MGLKRTGLDPLAYLGVEPSSPSQFVIEEDNPNQNDWQNFNVGTIWLNTTTQVPWMLVSLARNQATWITLGGSSSSVVQTLTTDGPTVVNPTSGNINVFSGTGIATSGSGSTVTVGVAADVPTTFQSGNDSSTAAPVFNTITFTGSGDSTVSAAGNVVTINSTGGSTGHPLITTYSTPGTYTWTKASGTTWIQVLGCNGGGGGGSGARGVSNNNTGGGGGGGGASFYSFFPATLIGSTASVVVGSGGTGASAVTVNTTVGNNGVVGGVSSFGSIMASASVPLGGQGGLITPPGSGSASGGNTAGASTQGGSGQIGGVGPALGTPGVNLVIFSNEMGATGGGAGGGSNSSAIVPGRVGGNIQQNGGSFTPGSVIYLQGGFAGVEGGGINGGDGSAAATGSGANGIFTFGTGGGGGGGQSAGSVAGIGGNGGFPGGGGGGGGSSLNGTASGAGGNGANGIVIVIEW